MYISKTVIAIFVSVLLAGGGAALWYTGALDGLASSLNFSMFSQNEEQVVEEEAEGTPQELATGSDSSDQALEQDLGQLDAELEAYSATEAELDASLADEPGAQEY